MEVEVAGLGVCVCGAGAALKMGLKVFTLLDLRDILFRLMDMDMTKPFHNFQQIVNSIK